MLYDGCPTSLRERAIRCTNHRVNSCGGGGVSVSIGENEGMCLIRTHPKECARQLQPLASLEGKRRVQECDFRLTRGSSITPKSLGAQ